MIGYAANGDATDWMLAARGIYAFSPELGTSDRGTNYFFIYLPETMKSVLQENYPWIRYTMMSLLPKENSNSVPSMETE